MIIKLYSTLALLMFSGLVNAFTVYDNKDNWIAALPSPDDYITEDFFDIDMVDELASYRVYDMNTGGMGMETFTEFQGFSLIPPPTFSGTQVFEELADGIGTTVWNFSSPFVAFGGNWDLSPGGSGTGLAISIDGIIQNNVVIPNTLTGEFWGFIADSPFSEVELLKPSAISGVELYHLDDMVFAAAVPLPAAFWLLGSGFIGLLGYKKRFSC